MTNAATRCRPALLFTSILLVWIAACAHPQRPAEITSQRATDIARQRISFQADNVSVIRAASGTRPVWRVTFRGRLPGQPPGLFETAVIDVDRISAEIVSAARN